MDKLRFDGKVVLVTGAGQGIGKAYALEFAKRGASVVVNDLGSTPGGIGSTSKVADNVVNEILRNGGRAVANYDSVEFGDKVVKTALDNFGRIDVIINNAGILRDRTLQRMTEEEWDLVNKVHLKAAFSITKAAWIHMKEQKYGRIILTSSTSGIYGNFGQSNYAAAKMGLVGFANTISLEGKKYNIQVNTIAPVALTRLTKNLMAENMQKHMKPEYIVPLVVYLCHDSCKDTGGIFEVSAGHISKLRWQRTKGAVLREEGKEMLAEDVKKNWSAVVDWTDAKGIDNGRQASMMTQEAITRMLDGENDLASDHPIKPAVAKRHVFEPVSVSHSESDVMLYALGIGVSRKQENHLRFLYERHEDFSVIPSFGVVCAFRAAALAGRAKGLDCDQAKNLHGEQYIELYKPIPRKATLTSKQKVVEVLDKGSGAAIITNIETFNESGEKLMLNQFVTFIVGAGGFRGKRSTELLKPVAKPPKRVPDAAVEEKTSIDQAALYRLGGGDFNPLHLDPDFSSKGGFKTPILHGLCTFGFSTRHIMKSFANDDPSRIRAIKVRFASPVLPGQTLRTEMWKEGNRVFFQTVVKETGVSCITGAYVDLNEDSPYLASNEIISGFAKNITSEMVRKLGAIIQWDITKDGKVVKSWEMNLSRGSCYIREGAAEHPGCTITISDDDAVQLFSGQLNPKVAFNQGKLTAKGVTLLARKLKILFPIEANL